MEMADELKVELVSIGVLGVGVCWIKLASKRLQQKYRMKNAARKIQFTWRTYQHNKWGSQLRHTVAKAVYKDRVKTQQIGVANEFNFRQLKETLKQRRQQIEEKEAEETAARLIQQTWKDCPCRHARLRRQKEEEATRLIQQTWKECPRRRQVHAIRKLRDLYRSFILRKHVIDCLASNSKQKAEADSAMRSQSSYSYGIELISGNNIPTSQAYAEIISEGSKHTTEIYKDRYYLSWKYTKATDVVKCKGTETKCVQFKVWSPTKLGPKCIGTTSIELNPMKDDNKQVHFLSLKIGDKVHERAGLVVVVEKKIVDTTSAPVA